MKKQTDIAYNNIGNGNRRKAAGNTRRNAPISARPIICASLLLATCLANPSAHAEVSLCTDANGRQVYCNNPNQYTASSATNLPTIARENIEKNIAQIQATAPDSCLQHGGEDCAKGADLDGSVICKNGFKDSPLKFEFRCHRAKIEISEPEFTMRPEDSDFQDTNPLLHPANCRKLALIATMRNLTDIEARNVKVSFVIESLPPPGKAPEPQEVEADVIPANGEDVVEPFGAVEYTANLPDSLCHKVDISKKALLERINVKVSCRNCFGINVK